MQSCDCAPGGMSKGSLITVTRKTVRSPPLSPTPLLQPVAAAISMVPLPPFFQLTLRSVPFVSVAPLPTLLQPAWRAITAVSMVLWQRHPCFRPPPPWGSIIPTAVSMWGPESWGRRTPPIMVSPPRPPVTKVSWAAVFWWTAQASWIMWMPCIPVWRWRIMLPPWGPLLLTTTGIWWIAVTLTRTIPKGAPISWHMLSILPWLLPWTTHELFIITWSVTHMQSSGTPSPSSPRKPKWFAINITSLDNYSKTQGEAVCNSQLLLFYTPSGESTMHGERCIIRHTSEAKKQAKKKRTCTKGRKPNYLPVFAAAVVVVVGGDCFFLLKFIPNAFSFYLSLNCRRSSRAGLLHKVAQWWWCMRVPLGKNTTTTDFRTLGSTESQSLLETRGIASLAHQLLVVSCRFLFFHRSLHFSTKPHWRWQWLPRTYHQTLIHSSLALRLKPLFPSPRTR